MKYSLERAVSNRRTNNLNAIRLVLAVLVILAHCFPLTLGREGDLLFTYSHNQTSFGGFAVDQFFFISGFLITASWLNCKSMNDYLRRRVLRIVPAYAVALVFSFLVAVVLAVHPLVNLPAHLAKFKCIFSLGYSSVQGDWVFPLNPYPFIANGSLWTISREFGCYLLIAGIGLFGFFKHRILIVAGSALVFIYYVMSLLNGVDIAYSDRRFYTFFLAGVSVWLWRDKIPINHYLAILAVSVTLATVWFPPWFTLLEPITASYLVLWVAYAFHINWMAWCDKTDLSYGVYLFAFPIQQCLAYCGVVDPWLMFILATPMIMGIAFLSWNLVEKPCLKLKSRDSSDYDPVLAISSAQTPTTADKINW